MSFRDPQVASQHRIYRLSKRDKHRAGGPGVTLELWWVRSTKLECEQRAAETNVLDACVGIIALFRAEIGSAVCDAAVYRGIRAAFGLRVPRRAPRARSDLQQIRGFSLTGSQSDHRDARAARLDLARARVRCTRVGVIRRAQR